MKNPLHTRFCDVAGIRYPIVQAPMAGGWTTPELVTAVTRAGGLGCIAGARTSVDGLARTIAAVRSGTDGPFAVNFLLAPPEPLSGDVESLQKRLDALRSVFDLEAAAGTLAAPASVLEETFQVAVEARVPILSFAMGDAGVWIERTHEAGARAMVMVTSVEEGVRAAEQGADVVVAQGSEAGGHRATADVSHDEPPLIGNFALVPALADAVRVPVIAAGGIMDGRGLIAALALGAAGVQMGTRFLLAHESGAFPEYRARLRAGTETSTRITRRLTGRPARAIRNRLLESLEDVATDPLPWPWPAIAANDLYQEAVRRGNAEFAVLLAGQGLRLAGDEMGAEEIVQDLMASAEACLVRLRGDPRRGPQQETRT